MSFFCDTIAALAAAAAVVARKSEYNHIYIYLHPDNYIYFFYPLPNHLRGVMTLSGRLQQPARSFSDSIKYILTSSISNSESI